MAERTIDFRGSALALGEPGVNFRLVAETCAGRGVARYGHRLEAIMQGVRSIPASGILVGLVNVRKSRL